MKAIESAMKETIDNSELKKKRKFTESIDVIVNLKNINLKDPSKRFNNEFQLPNVINDNPRICFIVDGDQLVEAKNLNVDSFDKDAIESLGKADKAEKRKVANKYDFFIASQAMMRFVAKNLGKILGPKGKMPRPMPQGYGVINTSDSLEPSIDRYKRIIRLKLAKFPLIQFKIGTKDMDSKTVSENAKAALDFIEHKMEKGRQNIKSVYLKTTMGKPVKLI
ncbi:MAG: 50S ribosomal protein L1 [Promethearchaeota archaeon]